MSNAYGKTALSCDIVMPDFDKYFAKIEAAGQNIDDLCIEAVDAALPIVEKSMKEGAERHEKTGAVVDAIEITPAKKEGNLIYGKVGIDMGKHPEAIHGVYQEYGDGHSPDFPDPFVRPAIDDNRAEVKKIMRDVLKRGGIPIESVG
jgi:HK97 gp10 family phage protein